MSPDKDQPEFPAEYAVEDAAEDAAEDPARTGRIAELKAKFRAGELALDEKKLASKLVDAHVRQPKQETTPSS